MRKPLKRPARIAKKAHIAKKDWDAIDSPELTAKDFAKMRPAMEALPPAIKRAVGQRGLGRKPAKIAVSLRLDPDVLKHFKDAGPYWQSRINETLRRAVARKPAARRTTRSEGGKKA
ncbi:MAG: BrnA antitoxin family protein [Pseudomonadota bacterium]